MKINNIKSTTIPWGRERRENEKYVINDNTDNIAWQSNPCRATREMKINNIKDTV